MQYWSRYFGCWRDDEDNDIPNDMPNDVSNDCEDDGPEYDEVEDGNKHILYFSDEELERWRALGKKLDKILGKSKNADQESDNNYDEFIENEDDNNPDIIHYHGSESLRWERLREKSENAKGKSSEDECITDFSCLDDIDIEDELRSLEEDEMGSGENGRE